MSLDRDITANLKLIPKTELAQKALKDLRKNTQDSLRSLEEMEKGAQNAGRTIQRELGDKAKQDLKQIQREADDAAKSLEKMGDVSAPSIQIGAGAGVTTTAQGQGTSLATSESMSVLDESLNVMTDSLDGVTISFDEATISLEEFQRQIEDELITAAENAGNAVRDLATAQNRTKEANQERLRALEIERVAIETELAALESKNSESETATKRIEFLREKLKDLGVEASIIGRVIRNVGEEAEESAPTMKRNVSAARNLTAELGAGLEPAIGAAGGAVREFSTIMGDVNKTTVTMAGATIALGIALGELNKQLDERKRIISAEIDIIKERAELSKMTSDQLREERAEREGLLEIEQRRLQDLQSLKSAIQETTDAQQGLTGAALDLQKALGITPEIDAVNDAISETETQVRILNGGLDSIDKTMRSTEVAANDAAAAIEALQEQLAEELLDSAEDAGEAIRNLEAAQNRNREANQDRLQAINAERRAIEAELKVLQSQATQSEEVTKRIEKLRESLSDLGAESEAVSRTIREGSRADREEAQEAARKRAEDQRRERENRRKEAAERLKEIREEAKKEREDALKEQIDFANKVADIEFKAAKDREKIAVDANREQARLIRESRQQFNQDFFQDFLGEFQRRQELAFNLQETQIAARQAFSDVNRDAFLAQQQLRAESGAQPLLSPSTTNNITFAGMSQQQTISNLIQLGVLPGG